MKLRDLDRERGEVESFRSVHAQGGDSSRKIISGLRNPVWTLFKVRETRTGPGLPRGQGLSISKWTRPRSHGFYSYLLNSFIIIFSCHHSRLVYNRLEIRITISSST